MNPEKIEKYFWSIIILWFLLRTILLGCQYFGNTNPTLKQNVLNYFTEKDIKESRAYALKGFWFKAIYGTINIFILIILLRFGFFNYLWNKVCLYVGASFYKRDLLFSILFFIVLYLLSFPTSFYFGYIKETESGFSNTNLSGWLFRYIKILGINVILQSMFFIVIIDIIKRFPVKWPWIVPISSVIIVAISIILMPMIITPLFYNEKPLEAGELRDKLFAVAHKANLSVKEIYVIDESRYSKHTNAYFSGFGNFKRIVLYDNLINSHTTDEAVLIFAHEAGHWKYNHMFWGLSCGFIGALIVCYLVYWIFDYLCLVKWFGLYRLDSASAIPFFMIAYMILQLIFSPIESQISQYMEKQADKTSIELTNLKNVFIDAQIRLARDNKSDLLPHPFRVFWLYSHPTSIDRIHLALDQ